MTFSFPVMLSYAIINIIYITMFKGFRCTLHLYTIKYKITYLENKKHI